MKDKVSPRKTRTYNKKKEKRDAKSTKNVESTPQTILEPNAGLALFVLKNNKGEVLKSEYKGDTFVVSFESKELAKKCRDKLNGHGGGASMSTPHWHVSPGPDHHDA